MEIPTQAEIEDKLRGEDLNTWLDLWRTEQGPPKPAALRLMASAIPFRLISAFEFWMWVAEPATRAATFIRDFRRRVSIP